MWEERTGYLHEPVRAFLLSNPDPRGTEAGDGGRGDAVTDESGAQGTFVTIAHSRSVPHSGSRFPRSMFSQMVFEAGVWEQCLRSCVVLPAQPQRSPCLQAVALWSGGKLPRLLQQTDLGVHLCSASFLSLRFTGPFHRTLEHLRGHWQSA